MLKTVIARLRRRAPVPSEPDRALVPDPPQHISLELGARWPWLSLAFIVWLHPGWGADQIAELLAVFTPYIMLSAPTRH